MLLTSGIKNPMHSLHNHPRPPPGEQEARNLCLHRWTFTSIWPSLVAQMVKNLLCNAGDLGSFPGSGREWLPPPILLSGKCHGERSLTSYSSGNRKDSDERAPSTLYLCFGYAYVLRLKTLCAKTHLKLVTLERLTVDSLHLCTHGV